MTASKRPAADSLRTHCNVECFAASRLCYLAFFLTAVDRTETAMGQVLDEFGFLFLSGTAILMWLVMAS
jgi:hypothetical protein